MNLYPTIKRLLPNFRLITTLLALSAAGAAPAATFCVTTSTQLQGALTVAQSNGQANTILVAAGNYMAPESGFRYDAFTGGNDNHLTIIGGWTEYSGYACGLRSQIDPFKTVLDGNDNTRVMWIRAGRNSDVTVRGLTFVEGNAWRGAGLYIDDVAAGYAATITIEGNAFTANSAGSFGGGLMVSVSSDDNDSAWLRVINNVFWGNHAANNFGGAAGIAFNGGAGMVISNNTVTHNSVGAIGTGIFAGGIYVEGSRDVPLYRVIANNNLWANNGADLHIDNSGPLHLLHNNISSLSGHVPTLSFGNISIVPEYEPSSSWPSWIPALHSPLVDGGIHPDPSSSWYLTEHDLTGKARVNGGRVDIGAYENHDRLFFDRFEAK